MKPYQFYMVKAFPPLVQDRPIRNVIQMTLSGEDERVETAVALTRQSPIGPFQRLAIETGIRHEVVGYTKIVLNGQRQTYRFEEYIRPVEFAGYLDRERGVLIMQGSRHVTTGFITNIKKAGTGIDLAEVEIDFAKIHELYPNCSGAWFRDVSPRVKSAGLSGDQVQNDTFFKSMQKLGKMSSLNMDYPYEGLHHPLVVGKRGAVVLVKNYRNIQTIEQRLVIDVFENLISKVWSERRTRWNMPPSVLEPE